MIVHPLNRSSASTLTLAPQIRSREIDQLVAAAAHHRLHHLEREALRHFQLILVNSGKFWRALSFAKRQHNLAIGETEQSAPLAVGSCCRLWRR
jgi:hypothetical protein